MKIGANRRYCSGYDSGVQSGDEESGLGSHRVSMWIRALQLVS